MAEFAIDSRILASSEPLCALKLCDARLQADARWPWVVLMPRKPGARELEHLSQKDRAQLMEEIVLAGSVVRAIGAALGRPVEKLNVGGLGNVVPQLHVHIVGRRLDDPCWPNPVWGVGASIRYADADLALAREAAMSVLDGLKA